MNEGVKTYGLEPDLRIQCELAGRIADVKKRLSGFVNGSAAILGMQVLPRYAAGMLQGRMALDDAIHLSVTSITKSGAD